MNRRNILSLSTFAALGLALLPTGAFAKQKSLKQQLVGTWTVVSVTNTQKDGSKFNPFGADSKGSLILTSEGHFSIINTRGDLPKFASNSRLQGTADENKAIVQGTLAQFGTYTVDEKDKTFTVHFDRSSFPADDGTNSKRPITLLTANELHFTNPAGTIGGTPSEIIAKRDM